MLSKLLKPQSEPRILCPPPPDPFGALHYFDTIDHAPAPRVFTSVPRTSATDTLRALLPLEPSSHRLLSCFAADTKPWVQLANAGAVLTSLKILTARTLVGSVMQAVNAGRVYHEPRLYSEVHKGSGMECDTAAPLSEGACSAGEGRSGEDRSGEDRSGVDPDTCPHLYDLLRLAVVGRMDTAGY